MENQKSKFKKIIKKIYDTLNFFDNYVFYIVEMIVKFIITSVIFFVLTQNNIIIPKTVNVLIIIWIIFPAINKMFTNLYFALNE